MRNGTMMPRPLLLAMLAAALLLRLMVPQGWMPMQTAAGWQIAMCSGQGPMRMAGMDHAMAGMDAGMNAGMDHAMAQDAKGKAPRPEHDPSQHPCAFAGIALPAIAAPLPLLALPFVATARVLTARPLLPSIGRGLAAPPPPATGPPASL